MRTLRCLSQTELESERVKRWRNYVVTLSGLALNLATLSDAEKVALRELVDRVMTMYPQHVSDPPWLSRWVMAFSIEAEVGNE